jgi:hypothetical protein
MQGGIAGTAVLVERPPPSKHLTDEQQQVWHEVLDDLPADWFRPSNLAFLEAYCRHVVASRRIAWLIQVEENSNTFNPLNYDLLLRMQERETRALTTVGTKMRLTQQSLVAHDKVKPRQTPGKKPWQE